MRAILRHPRALGVAEMMNFPGVIAGDPDVLARMVAPHVDGHAPGVIGPRAGRLRRRRDRRPTTRRSPPQEALEKRRRGMWVLIREASNARNLIALLAMVREHGPDYCAFCTDDREPDFLLPRGPHRPDVPASPSREGIAAEDVLVMASLHGARAHRLLDRGAIAPGYVADLVAARRPASPSGVAACSRTGASRSYPGGVAGRAARHDALGPGRVRHPRHAGAGAGDRHPARAS